MTFTNAERRRLFSVGLSAAALMGLPRLGGAQEKTVKFILPNGAGSGVDTITRTMAPAFGKALGVNVVVDNQPGAGGIVGTQTMVRSPADGSTLSIVSNNHVIYPSLHKSLPFDPIADITPISVLGTTPLVLVVNPAKVPATNAKELVAFLKAKPDAYNYASSGNGTILHLAAEMFVEEAGVKVKHIPYKGVGPMVTDIIGGQVEFGVLALPSVQGHIKSGAVRAIGVTGANRTPALDLATFAEQGMPGYVVDAWFGLIGPAKIPAEEVKRLHAAIVAAFNAPEVKEAMAKQGNAINIQSPEAAAQFFKAETVKYAALVKKARLTLD